MITENLLLLAVAIPVMGFLLYAGLQFFRLIFSYELTDKNISVRLFHFLSIYKIPFEKIVEIHSAPLHEVAFIPGMHLFTRPFAKRVVIQQRDRWFIYAFLTPDDPDAFIAEIKKHLSAFS